VRPDQESDLSISEIAQCRGALKVRLAKREHTKAGISQAVRIDCKAMTDSSQKQTKIQAKFPMTSKTFGRLHKTPKARQWPSPRLALVISSGESAISFAFADRVTKETA
jgi:hypothetical protein